MAGISKTALRLAGVAVIAFAVAACATKPATRGTLPTKEQITLLAPGVHGREDVRSILGSPSVVGTFDENAWYYIGRRTTQFAFFERNTVEQQVLIIRFDDTGTLYQVVRLDESDGRRIVLAESETPSAGRELGFFEQLFGNFGRFNTGGAAP